MKVRILFLNALATGLLVYSGSALAEHDGEFSSQRATAPTAPSAPQNPLAGIPDYELPLAKRTLRATEQLKRLTPKRIQEEALQFAGRSIQEGGLGLPFDKALEFSNWANVLPKDRKAEALAIYEEAFVTAMTSPRQGGLGMNYQNARRFAAHAAVHPKGVKYLTAYHLARSYAELLEQGPQLSAAAAEKLSQKLAAQADPFEAIALHAKYYADAVKSTYRGGLGYTPDQAMKYANDKAKIK